MSPNRVPPRCAPHAAVTIDLADPLQQHRYRKRTWICRSLSACKASCSCHTFTIAFHIQIIAHLRQPRTRIHASQHNRRPYRPPFHICPSFVRHPRLLPRPPRPRPQPQPSPTPHPSTRHPLNSDLPQQRASRSHSQQRPYVVCKQNIRPGLSNRPSLFSNSTFDFPFPFVRASLPQRPRSPAKTSVPYGRMALIHIRHSIPLFIHSLFRIHPSADMNHPNNAARAYGKVAFNYFTYHQTGGRSLSIPHIPL